MAEVTLNKFLRKRKKNVQAIYFHLLPGFGFFKCWRKRKKNFDARSQQAFSTLKFWRKKRRKMSKLNIFTCHKVPASLVYLHIVIRIANSCTRLRWIFKGLSPEKRCFSHRIREGRIFLTSSLPSSMLYPSTLTLPQFVEYRGLSK